MLSRINLFILKNPSVLITKTFFRGAFPLFFFFNAASDNPSPCAWHIAAFLQQRAGVMIEMRGGKKQCESKSWKNYETCPFLWFLAWIHCFVMSFGFQVHHGLGYVGFLNLLVFVEVIWGTEAQKGLHKVLHKFRDTLVGGIWPWLV